MSLCAATLLIVTLIGSRALWFWVEDNGQRAGDGIHVTHTNTDPWIRCGKTRAHMPHLHWQAQTQTQERINSESPDCSAIRQSTTDGNWAAALCCGSRDKGDRITQWGNASFFLTPQYIHQTHMKLWTPTTRQADTHTLQLIFAKTFSKSWDQIYTAFQFIIQMRLRYHFSQ